MKHKGRHTKLHALPSDVKIIIFLVGIALVITVIYFITDEVFNLFDQQQVNVRYQQYQSGYTSAPTNEATDPGTKAKPNPNRFLMDRTMTRFGFVHPVIIYLISGIVAICIIGFVFFFIFNRLRQS